jgi:hypothetical protein
MVWLAASAIRRDLRHQRLFAMSARVFPRTTTTLKTATAKGGATR